MFPMEPVNISEISSISILKNSVFFVKMIIRNYVEKNSTLKGFVDFIYRF